MRCPECYSVLDLGNLKCKNGHQFRKEKDIYILMKASFEKHLKDYLLKFEPVRKQQNQRIIDPAAYNKLPYFEDDFPEHLKKIWIHRQYDLELIKPFILDQPSLNILNFGGWNGWICNQLRNHNHHVTAISYFIDKWDGLGAVEHYDNNWTSIQMDIEDVTILDDSYDSIIFNRGLEYVKQPVELLEQLIDKLNPNGFLLITGIQSFRLPFLKIWQQKKQHAAFKKKHGFDLLLRPVKGILDFKDKQKIEALGIKFLENPFLNNKNMRAKWLPIFPMNYYAVFKK